MSADISNTIPIPEENEIAMDKMLKLVDKNGKTIELSAE